jgi:hypothetical protein
MAVWRQAWQGTELIRANRLVYTLGFGVLTLLLNFVFGLRPWQITIWFVLSYVAGYAMLTLVAFLYRAAFIGIQTQWNGFLAQLKGEILGSIHEALPPSSVQPYVGQSFPWFLFPETKKLFIDMLVQEPGEAYIRSCMGDARSFQFADQLKEAFTMAGWTVRHDPDPIGSQSPGLRLVADLGNMAESAKLVANALNRIDVPFVPERLSVADKEAWYLVVGRLT